ncbi:MAG: hypothetical protein WD971_00185 [Pirellulales bacterium]
MSTVSQQTLEERVATLEHQVEQLTKRLLPGEKLPPEKDWRSTVGMFANDPIMKDIIEEGRKIRELDREQTRG